MRTRWMKAELENVLIQLNNRFLPFKKFCFSQNEDGLILLGSGGYANVYEMELRENAELKYSVKVLGFGDKHVDSEEFRTSTQIQKELALFENDVVKVIDYVELRVSIDMECQILDVEKLGEYKEKASKGEFLYLQFILMEKLVPILTTDHMGRPKLHPEKLADFDENEIMKLAHNIGNALARAHEKKLLHRDIKLENVFYDPKKKVYKLGDFGIAKMTDDGMASTVAFTKGYGAPEVVGAVDERYDDTADIYSFGIMLYLLLNELKFPDSENYNVNVALQYSKGYQFPYPIHGDYALGPVLEGMCQYNPDDRYQSMETVMNEIEGIMLGDDIRYKKENVKATYVAGFVCYMVGMIMWKLTHMPELTLDIGLWGYIFLVAGGVVYGLNLKKKEHIILSIAMLSLGIYLLISTGFTWWKLLLVLGVSFSTGSFAGISVTGIAIVDILSRLIQVYPQMCLNMQEYGWTALLFLSFSGILFWQCMVLGYRDIKLNGMYYKKNIYWILIIVMYSCIFLMDFATENLGYGTAFWFKLIDAYRQLGENYNLKLLGSGGLVLSVGWMTRECVLRKWDETLQGVCKNKVK